jgi:hypothetical protein
MKSWQTEKIVIILTSRIGSRQHYPAYTLNYVGIFYCGQYRLTYLFLITVTKDSNITVEVSGRPRPDFKPDVRLPGVVSGRMLTHSTSRIYKSLTSEPYAAVISCRTRETRFLHHEGTFSRKFPIDISVST